MKIKLIPFIFLLITSINLQAQTSISGKVTAFDNTPLEGASVYLNNTSVGTITNSEGGFELLIEDGTYDLIVSFIGYETMQYGLDSKTFSEPLLFKLKPKTSILDEVVISNKKISAEDRAYFMQRFKASFIGGTNLSQTCKIVNEKAINFDFDKDTNTLVAYANEPIKIKHQGLGYFVYYDLVDFELSPNKVAFLGYTRYQSLEGSKRKNKKWKKNRVKAYNGSSVHFLKSIINRNIKDEGFVVDQFKRIPNPDRPSDSVLDATRKYMKTLLRNLSNKKELISNINMPTDNFIVKLKETLSIPNVNNNEKNDPKIDSCMAIIRKSKLKKFVDIDIRKGLNLNDFSSKNENMHSLRFDDYLRIRYNNEPEEYNYRPGDARLDHQVSMIKMYVESSPFYETGILVSPLDIFLEGYWSYEKIADLLPLDYEPEK